MAGLGAGGAAPAFGGPLMKSFQVAADLFEGHAHLADRLPGQAGPETVFLIDEQGLQYPAVGCLALETA